MSEAKERPILFNGPMVCAVLDGRKTVTRRALSARSLKEIGYGVQLGECHELPADGQVHPNSASYYAELCPFGLPGDRLWVRETWFCDHFEVMSGPYLKPADFDAEEARNDGTLVYAADGLTPYEADQPVWKPSIHMPRWACRILLEITDVRVERLQHITIGQICKEGLARSMYEFKPVTQAFDAFAELWNSTGGDWDANPWVWVVEFKRVMVPALGCNYQGRHFGAPYPDAQCVDGFLWDEDSCDEPGGPLLHGGDIPCPQCNAEAHAAYLSEGCQP